MGFRIIGALASILSSLLVGSPLAPKVIETTATAIAPSLEIEIVAMKNELAAMHWLFDKIDPTSEEQDAWPAMHTINPGISGEGNPT